MNKLIIYSNLKTINEIIINSIDLEFLFLKNKNTISIYILSRKPYTLKIY